MLPAHRAWSYFISPPKLENHRSSWHLPYSIAPMYCVQNHEGVIFVNVLTGNPQNLQTALLAGNKALHMFNPIYHIVVSQLNSPVLVHS